MEGDAEPARDLARAQQQSRGVGARHTELTFQRNEAVRVGTGQAEEQVEVLRPAGRLHDLVEFLVRVEGEAAHAELAVGAHDCSARLDRIHEIELGVGDARHALDFHERGDIEGPHAGFHQGIHDHGRVVGLGGVEHPAGEVGEKPIRRAPRGVRPQCKDRTLGVAIAEKVDGRSENVHPVSTPHRLTVHAKILSAVLTARRTSVFLLTPSNGTQEPYETQTFGSS